MDSVQALGFSPTGRLDQLNSLENRVYRIEIEAGTRTASTDGDAKENADENRFLVGKFYRPGRWSDGQIVDEHLFIKSLTDSGIPACPPLIIDGESLFEMDGARFALWDAAPGRIPDELGEKELFKAGRLLAGIHAAGERFSLAAASRFPGTRERALSRPAFNADTVVRDPLAGMLARGDIPRAFAPEYEKLALSVAAALDASLEGHPVHYIHGDFHWGNLLLDKGEFRVLDFDDCGPGPAAQDLWMIASDEDGSSGRPRLGALLAGYRSIRPFEEKWIEAIPALRAARFIDFSAWISLRRDDPAFIRSFPDYGSAEYWEGELRDIDRALHAIAKASPPPEDSKTAALRKEYEAAEGLTDKDYFFDLE